MFGQKPKNTRRIRLPFESRDEKPYIFASYGHDDKEKVFPILRMLYESGYNIWYDEGITIGEKYDEVIEAHIRQSDVFLLFASSLSLSRPYVLDVELRIAREIRSRTPFLALMLEKDIDVPAKAEDLLRNAACHRPEEIIDRLQQLGITCFGKRKAIPIERDVPPYWFDSYDPDAAGAGGQTVYSAEEPYACLAFHPDDTPACNPYAKELYFAGYNVRSCEKAEDSERLRLIASKGCRAFVPFITRQYVESGRFEQDYKAARKAGKPLIALYIRSDGEDEDSRITLPESIAEEVSMRQGLDMRELTQNDFLSKLESELETRKCYAAMKDGKVIRRSFEIRDFLYDFTDDGKKLVLTRYRGETAASADAPASLTVRRAYAGFPVKEIGQSAFRYAHGPEQIRIQDGIEAIGEAAFAGCGHTACVSMPDSILSLGEDAFKGCDALREVNLSAGLTSISKRAFEDCDSLRSVVIPPGVTDIGQSAFSQCVGLESVVIPDSVTSIGDTAFYQCECLTSVVLPDSVQHFGDGVFAWCVSLASVTLSRRMASVGSESFTGCSALTHIGLHEGLQTVDAYAFYMADGLQSVTVPASVTEIGEHAFEGCDALRTVTVLSPDTTIGEGVFDDCLELETVRCPEGSDVWEYCEEEDIDCEAL